MTKNPFLRVLVFCGVAVSLSVSAANRKVAADSPFAADATLRLDTVSGETCMDLLLMTSGVLGKQVDTEELKTFTYVSAAEMVRAQQYFDPSVIRKLTTLFKSDDGLSNLVTALQGQQVTALTAAGAIGKVLRANPGWLKDPTKIALYSVELAPFLGIISGGGTRVIIDDNNYIIHYGYKPVAADKATQDVNVKSGRSFYSSHGQKLIDPSDVFYLKALQGFLDNTPDTKSFYDAALRLILKNDATGFNRLSPVEQNVATALLAVYQAESFRFRMTGFKAHEWQVDLLAVTVLEAWGDQAKQIEKGGKIIPGIPTDWFGVGKSGSGIGETRKDRMALQLAVTKAYKGLAAKSGVNPSDIVSKVESLIGAKPGGDIFQEFLVYINEPSNQPAIRAHADALIGAFSDFLTQVRLRADDIGKVISATSGANSP